MDVDTASRRAASMLILTVSGLNVLGPVLAQGPVSRLTVNNPNVELGLVLWLWLG